MTSFQRPRIGLVVPSLVTGGGIQAVARFIKDTILRSGRYELKLISLAMGRDDPENIRITSPRSWFPHRSTSFGVWDGLPFIHVGAIGSELEFQRYRPRKALQRVLADCDLIQVVSGSAAWANAVVGLRKPVALHVATRAKIERRLRDQNPRSALDWWRKWMTKVTDYMDDSALRQVDAIQVMNMQMLEYARDINTGRTVDVRYAPPGVDCEFLRPLNRSEPESDAYILCVARLADVRKNLSILLKAYALFPGAVRERVRLIFAGASQPPSIFWRHAEALGIQHRITVLSSPSRNQLMRLYQGALAFALPSDEEGFGVVLLEAMSCGVPVVSTRSGGPDAIITDGQDGYLVPVNDTVALSSRLRRLIEDAQLNVEMGREARRTIEKRFCEAKAGATFIDVWDRLTSAKSTV